MKTPTTVLFLTLLLCTASVAQTVTHHTRPIIRHGYYSLKASYPVLEGNSPLATFANRTLADWVRAQQQTFLAMAKKSLGHGRPEFAPYESQIDSFSHYDAAPRLYSVGMENYQYADGAHGDTPRTTFNFALVNGQPKRLQLADFFAPGTDSRRHVQVLLMAKLHKDSRAQFIGEVKTLSTAQLNRFVIERDGLRFWFDPYEVASYAAGPIDVKLTVAELGPDFKRSLLHAR